MLLDAHIFQDLQNGRSRKRKRRGQAGGRARLPHAPLFHLLFHVSLNLRPHNFQRFRLPLHPHGTDGDSVGAILCDLGNAYQHIGGRQRNGTALFRFLLFPGSDTEMSVGRAP